MATALLVITSIAAVGGVVQQRKIGKTQRKQNKLTNKIAAITRTRNIKRAIAASRITTAQQVAAGFQLGVSGGTAVQGAVAGVQSDTSSAIGTSNLQLTGQQFSAGFANQISQARTNQAAFSAIGSISGGLANNPQAVAALESLVG